MAPAIFIVDAPPVVYWNSSPYGLARRLDAGRGLGRLVRGRWALVGRRCKRRGHDASIRHRAPCRRHARGDVRLGEASADRLGRCVRRLRRAPRGVYVVELAARRTYVPVSCRRRLARARLDTRGPQARLDSIVVRPACALWTAVSTCGTTRGASRTCSRRLQRRPQSRPTSRPPTAAMLAWLGSGESSSLAVAGRSSSAGGASSRGCTRASRQPRAWSWGLPLEPSRPPAGRITAVLARPGGMLVTGGLGGEVVAWEREED